MKILIVHPQMALYAGAEIVVVRLAHYLQSHGHEVSILTLSTANHPDYKGLEFILPDKESEHIQYRLRGSLGAVRDILRMYRTLHRLCVEHSDSFDVINVHNFPAIWAVPNKRKIVWMCNEVPELWHSDSTSSLLNQLLNTGRLTDRLIARSKLPVAVVADEQCAQRFQHRYGMKPEIIPYGIDGEFFSQNVIMGRCLKFCVIHPAMVSPSKNQLGVLEALRGRTKVIFVGYREPLHPYTQQLERYIEDKGIDATFTGQVSRGELRALYRFAHVAVFPGKGQGSWLGPFEALAAGCPIIVSPNLSCSALIQQHNLGAVTSDIADTLPKIHHNYPKYQEQALRGREYVLENLTWDKFGERMLELMEK